MDDKKTISAVVKVNKSGPIKVTGNFEITGVDGKVIKLENTETFLCACGRSKTKPFCDGTHKKFYAWD
jgi:CDGSH-type Zn-finger protein